MKDFEEIGKWLPFCDNEIGVFQYVFKNYMIDNIDKFDAMEGFRLATLAAQTQYQMRVLKERINHAKNSNADIKLNNDYINAILSYDGLIDYVINAMTTSFKQLDILSEYQYKIQNNCSYFVISDEVKQELINDIKKIKV